MSRQITFVEMNDADKAIVRFTLSKTCLIRDARTQRGLLDGPAAREG